MEKGLASVRQCCHLFAYLRHFPPPAWAKESLSKAKRLRPSSPMYAGCFYIGAGAPHIPNISRSFRALSS